jgi:hypothetical protein
MELSSRTPREPLPCGTWLYEIRRRGELVAVEESHFDTSTIVISRRSPDGLSRHHAEGTLTPEYQIERVTLTYSSSLFTRKASYQAVDDTLRGRIRGVAGHNEIVVSLGRLREVDVGGFLLFRALTIGHIRMRGEQHWTGRVAVIDPNTLAAASIKRHCRRDNSSARSWIYEPRMGDTEYIELDEAGRIVRWRDNRDTSAELTAGDN